MIVVLLARLFPGRSWQSTATEAEETLRRWIVFAGRSGVVRRSRWTHRPNGDFSDSWLRGMPTAARPSVLDGHEKGALR